ncbi:MAG: type II secretion system protein [Campylobacteraceae bacterium]|jgi:hypothetical protein|nr:type II secretion system protein [Campylobacteraceae bacterium]
MKKGFSLLTAIMFIVFIATIGALALSFTTQTSKQTYDVYLRAQAELLARSATEYALLALSANDHNVRCLQKIDTNYDNIFNINMTLSYIGNNITTAGLTATAGTLGCANVNVLASNIATVASSPTVIIDTIVETTLGTATEPIRVHRRTLQKP